MTFNASKCVHLTITHKTLPFPSQYSISNHAIHQATSAKYLGVILTNNLSWSEHITKITNKANSNRAFLQRNLSQCQSSVKSACYTTYVRPILEYASTVWSPHLLCDIKILKKGNRDQQNYLHFLDVKNVWKQVKIKKVLASEGLQDKVWTRLKIKKYGNSTRQKYGAGSKIVKNEIL